jgi:hypothetical protein
MYSKLSSCCSLIGVIKKALLRITQNNGHVYDVSCQHNIVLNCANFSDEDCMFFMRGLRMQR